MPIKLKRIDHIAIICHSTTYQKTKIFYTEILGCKVIQETYRKERDSFKLDLAIGDDYQIELFSFPNPPQRVSNPEACGLRHLAFKVENLDEAIVELNKNGVNVEPVRIDTTRQGVRFTFFFDPNGQPLELCEAKLD